MVKKKTPQGRLKRSSDFLIEHEIGLLMIPNVVWLLFFLVLLILSLNQPDYTVNSGFYSAI